MKVAIIEDELPAIENLRELLRETGLPVTVVATLTSLSEAREYLNTKPLPDLFFMDIELGDGQSLSLLDEFRVHCPVIFTTAYDEYWQAAFEKNGIDYLLKPLKKSRVQSALAKYRSLKSHYLQARNIIQKEKVYLVKKGLDYHRIPESEIAYCYAADRVVMMVTHDAKKFVMDKTLADFEKELQPENFYRVNRKFLVSAFAIKNIKALQKSKLRIILQPPAPYDVIVSSDSARPFKEWLRTQLPGNGVKALPEKSFLS